MNNRIDISSTCNCILLTMLLIAFLWTPFPTSIFKPGFKSPRAYASCNWTMDTKKTIKEYSNNDSTNECCNLTEHLEWHRNKTENLPPHPNHLIQDLMLLTCFRLQNRPCFWTKSQEFNKNGIFVRIEHHNDDNRNTKLNRNSCRKKLLSFFASNVYLRWLFARGSSKAQRFDLPTQ